MKIMSVLRPVTIFVYNTDIFRHILRKKINYYLFLRITFCNIFDIILLYYSSPIFISHTLLYSIKKEEEEEIM